jgi:hypothetical protein
MVSAHPVCWLKPVRIFSFPVNYLAFLSLLESPRRSAALPFDKGRRKICPVHVHINKKFYGYTKEKDGK